MTVPSVPMQYGSVASMGLRTAARSGLSILLHIWCMKAASALILIVKFKPASFLAHGQALGQVVLKALAAAHFCMHLVSVMATG